ncbi:MAG: EAL domain-containing protein [Caulobacteraceae bacterium]|nr:EAL domain-containing protein [Caulobacter sp.]
MTSYVLQLATGHDLGLLAFAFAFAFAAFLGVFRLRARMSDTRGLVRTAWIFLCGLEAGGAVWATQFILLLGFHPGAPYAFDTLQALFALLVSATGTALAFGVAWSGREGLRLVAGAFLLAGAVAASNYVGLIAWHVQAHVDYEALGVWASVLLALLLSTAALIETDTGEVRWRQASAAALVTLAVGGLHLVGMRAMSLTPSSAPLAPGLVDGGVLILLVVTLSVLLTLVGVGAAYIDDAGSRAALARSRRLTEATREGIVVLDAAGRIVDANTAFGKLAALDLASLQGRELVGGVLALEGREMAPGHTQEALLRAGSGETFPVEVHLSALDEGSAGAAVSVRDLRERREAERMIRHLADHDAMTGLANRTVMQRLIADALSQNAGGTVMVVCLNVDNSKEVNETFGHAAGDALLTRIATRLKRFEAASRCTAGRIGGNEFALLVFGASEEGMVAASDMLSRLGKSLRRPLPFDEVTLEPRISIGVAGYPFDAQSASELLLHADLALKEARESGEAFCFFSHDYQDALHARRNLLGDLRKGLARDELVVFYQPQADAESGRICGFEALVRWRHPERGLLGPDKFIPLAEETGLIVELGEQVLRRACADAALWPRSVGVAVNLSALQLGDPRIVTLVHEVLLETGLSPARLELEITETALTRDFQAALDALRRLKAMGVRVAMDDFGTGYSSLSTLHSFPFDKIKIDKSFVDGLGQLERSTVIVRSVLGMAAGLGMPVTAEGVETPVQREILRAEGCAELQGYLIGKPAPMEAHAGLLAGEARAAA